jgi:metallo-beta-lactamase family protein
VETKLTFLGATQNVTGSRYLLETSNARILIDCGLFQEREFLYRNWEPFHVPAGSIDAILVTHAHLDHCGFIPRIYRQGFRGDIYCTHATADIAEVMLLDSAKIQEEDAAFKRKRHQREGRRGRYPEIPLYTVKDAEASLACFTHRIKYKESIVIANGIEAGFHDAGHVLGSAMIKLTLNEGTEKRTVIFSGDIGRWHVPILRDPTLFPEADYVLVESTYGDRLHGEQAGIGDRLAEIINSTYKAGGHIVIPSFALERSQELLYYLNKLLITKRIPQLPVYLDSPMAIKVTEIFKDYPSVYDQDMTRLLEMNRSPFRLPGLKMTDTVEDSKAINELSSPAIIIAGSGMCTGGRIKHHLVNNISRPESTILFIGYQARGTLGRHIVEGNKGVRILGQPRRVRARIEQLDGFSAHADRDELMKWLSAFKKPPRQVFLTHGESEVIERFCRYIKEKTGWKVAAPTYKSHVIIE